MPNISFYGSHNSAYVIEDEGKIITVLEVERFLNLKNSGMAQYMCPKVSDLLFLAKYIPEFLMKTFNIEKFDNCYYLNADVIIDTVHHLQTFIPADNYIECKHHEAHTAGAFYQSPYEKALIFS
jgi:predicted NodU family carbamoyl transferase